MILIFSDDADFGSSLAARLRELEIPASSHDPDFADRVCECLDFNGVILDGRTHEADYVALSERLFGRYPDLPIAFLMRPNAKIFPCASHPIRITEAVPLFDLLSDFSRTCVGSMDYRTFALWHCSETKEFTYLGYPLPLSDYEHRFLLCLFRHAPEAVSTDELLSTAFPNTCTPHSTLWTLAKRINQASKAISGLKLVQCAYGKGYRLCDGIVKKQSQRSTL
ncbi:MAG: hypothetical protein IKC59_05005 [Clostridia bacterium]|nr:hypothetical protein [Clostridia bacterium]